jgi:hypothetical protein
MFTPGERRPPTQNSLNKNLGGSYKRFQVKSSSIDTELTDVIRKTPIVYLTFQKHSIQLPNTSNDTNSQVGASDFDEAFYEQADANNVSVTQSKEPNQIKRQSDSNIT